MSTNTKKTKAELEAELEIMKEQLAVLQASLDLQRQQAHVAPAAAPIYTMPRTDVTLVYMSDSPGYIEAGDLKLNATCFGEEFNISRTQFDTVVGKYRKWFTDGILAVSPKDVEIAAQKGIKTSDEYKLTNAILGKLGTMSLDKLEALWNSLDSREQRMSVVTYCKKKFIEGKEPGFREIGRIDVLNRLSNNGFERERNELLGHTKIEKTAM